MRLSWRLLLLRSYLQKPTSFSYRKVLSSSISSPFQTQSRITHTQTTNSRKPIYPSGSFDFSPAHGVTKEKRDKLEKVAENINVIEKKMDELEEDLKWSITEITKAVEEKRDELEEDLKWSITENINAVEEKSEEVEKDLMDILEGMKGCVEEGMEYDTEEELKEIATMAKWSEEFWDMSYIKAVDTLIKFSDEDDIERELNGLGIDQYLIKNVLEGFESNPNVAKRFFHFLLHKDGDELDFEFYGPLCNSMLCVFGVNRLFGDFWDLAETMNAKRCRVSLSSCKEKQHLIHMDTWDKLTEFYCKHGLASELQKLDRFVVIQYMDNSMRNIAQLLNLVCLKMYHDMISVEVYGDFVKFVLEHTRGREALRLRFLRWIAGCDNLGKLNEQTCDFIASVLGKEDDKYSNLVDHLKMSGDDSDEGGWPVSREISEFYKDAVACSDTVPSVNCCIYLIMKIRLYDNELCFSDLSPDAGRVIDAFEENGGILTDSDVSKVINMFLSGNKIKDLNVLADQAIHSTYLVVRDHPFSFTKSSYTESYTELDRQRRARLMFSDLQKEVSGGTSY